MTLTGRWSVVGRLDRVEMLIRYTRANTGERAAEEARRLDLGALRRR